MLLCSDIIIYMQLIIYFEISFFLVNGDCPPQNLLWL